MKTSVGCIAVILFSCWLPVSAQNNLQLSLEAGPNFSNMEQVDADDFKSFYDSGNHLGVHLQYQINKKILVYTGLGFSEVHFDREYTTEQFGYGDRLPDVIALTYQFKTIDIPWVYGIPFPLKQ